MKEVLALTFAGGKRLQHTIPATAGNVIYNASPALGKRWLILRGIIDVVCDATVVNRYIVLTITDGTDITSQLGLTNAITASQNSLLSFGEARIGISFTLGNEFYLGIDPIVIEEADQFRIRLSGGVVGDSYSGFLVVLEL